jgi:multimeric flavodoxin WrbA
MKITILNGNSERDGTPFDGFLNGLKAKLESGGHRVSLLNLRDLDIRPCLGCFGCWFKTPGECCIGDDSQEVSRAMINSDFTLWAAPLVMGFPSAVLKNATDRSVPLVHPHIEVDHNEAHHAARYPRYPRLGMILGKEPETDERVVGIVDDIFCRTALNLKSRLEFCLTTEASLEDVAAGIVAARSFRRRLPAYPKPTRGTRVEPPKSLTVFNGSPHGEKGNTARLFSNFIEGFGSLEGNGFQMHYLKRNPRMDELVGAFSDAQAVWIGFPLYTDSMPGPAKAFIEALKPLCGRKNNPPVGFFIQSGFPEAVHSRYVERYLESLCARLGSPYLGTIIKGGGESMGQGPGPAAEKVMRALYDLGRHFAETGSIDRAGLLGTIAGVERFPLVTAMIFRMIVKLPMFKGMFDKILKANGAYERSFSAPYLE